MYNPEGLKIVTGDKKELRQKAKEVENIKSQEIQTLIKQMLQTLKINNGIGLAAPQINQCLRLFVIELDYEQYVIINPKIKNLSKDCILMEEGCLSFPNIFKPVNRSKKITIKYLNEEGKKKKLKAKGLLARAIQHEYDHLEGIVFLDRVKDK